MGMFCYQCQDAVKGTGCNRIGACGKTEDIAKLQDLLIYTMKGIGYLVQESKEDVTTISVVNEAVLKGMVMTSPYLNYDWQQLESHFIYLLELRDAIVSDKELDDLPDAVYFHVSSMEDIRKKAGTIGIQVEKNHEIRNQKELILYGMKGMSEFILEAYHLGKQDMSLYEFMYKTLAILLEGGLEQSDLEKIMLEVGEMGIRAMTLLDDAKTTRYGVPLIGRQPSTVGERQGILVSGTDFTVLEQILDQTQGMNLDVYTHGEMSCALNYPYFQKYKNLVGCYGNSWRFQVEDFGDFKGAILMASGILIPPGRPGLRNRVFTTDVNAYPGCAHFERQFDGSFDFARLISMAKRLLPPEPIRNTGFVSGYGHEQLHTEMERMHTLLQDSKLKSPSEETEKARKILVIIGSDGQGIYRNSYRNLVVKNEHNAIVMTAGTIKYRFMDLCFQNKKGDDNIWDFGQLGDVYSLMVTLFRLKDLTGKESIHELPLEFHLVWHEPKSILVLLALIHLGIDRIYLGPDIPPFIPQSMLEDKVHAYPDAYTREGKKDFILLR